MSGISRRRLLESAGVAASGAALGAFGRGLADEASATSAGPIPFHARHQAGITTAPQAQLAFAAFDVTAREAAALGGLLRVWSRAAERLTRGEPVGNAPAAGPARLTVTFGFGASLFDGRFGIAQRRPPALEDLPAFRGEELDPARSNGDLAVQACADDPDVAFGAIRALAELGRGSAIVRWIQRGFRGAPRDGVSRNLIGFRDGTNNLDPRDASAMAANVWAGDPDWMRDGTYLVVRRVRLRVEHWDSVSVAEQERTIGRRKASGASVGRRLPADSHVRVANPGSTGSDSERILRRSYSFAEGLDPSFGELEAGLFFICFQRDPRRQFVPIQRRLAVHDHLGEYTFNTGSGLFAVPPGIRPGSYVGQDLLGTAA
jgi:deferrochelatase/peroxidase EfeB